MLRERAEIVRKSIETLSLTHQGESLGKITLAAGVAMFPIHGVDNNSIIAAADTALYKAKQNGRNRVEFV